MKNILLIITFLSISSIGFSQKYFDKNESVLASKKWTVIEVKSKDPVFEVGEEVRFDIDKKFQVSKNDYSFMTGKWFLDDKYLILNVEGADGLKRGKKVPQKMKIIKMSKTELKVKFKTEDTKERILFK